MLAEDMLNRSIQDREGPRHPIRYNSNTEHNNLLRQKPSPPL